MDSNEINSSSDLQSLDNNPDSTIPGLIILVNKKYWYLAQIGIYSESDNDSGIVAIANRNRIGSTASNSDEDNLFKDK